MSDTNESTDDDDDVYVYELTSTLSPGCDHHECDLAAQKLYLGLSIEDDTARTFPAMYCDDHAEEMGESDEHKHLLGSITGLSRA